MSDRFFIDTNIFVYSFDFSDNEKRERARAIISNSLKESTGVISNQVVQEFINVATRKFETPLTTEDCRTYVEKIMVPLWEVSASPALIIEALEIKERWKYSFYDSMIISAAIMANCSILYSEDLHSSQQIQSLEIVNPFE
ncbi:MAG: PIN domain-containing protein [Cytophagales bacterium]|nr:PIN domain-containing protein [Cytophagales bacterium]